jgi:3-isopropylmalate dehydratase small subunit
MSSDAAAILPLLFADFDPSFSKNARAGDIIIAGDNFGCGSSREHPSVGLAHLGIRAVIIKSVNRIFYRSSINQGLPLIVHREAVEAYKPGDKIDIDFDKGSLTIAGKHFTFQPLPPELKQIIEKKGLVNWMKSA